MPDIITIPLMVVAGVFACLVLPIWIIFAIKNSRFRKQALECIGDEVSVHDDISANLAYRGVYRHLLGDHIDAIAYLEEALKFSEMSQNTAFCFDWLARCYTALDKPSDELRCRIKAVEAEPSCLATLHNLAALYAAQGQYEKAVFYYEKMLRLNDDNPNTAFTLGLIYMSRGQYDAAEALLDKVLEFSLKDAIPGKHFTAIGELAVIAAIKGEYRKMQSHFEKLKDMDSEEAMRLKGRLEAIKNMRNLCNDY